MKLPLTPSSPGEVCSRCRHRPRATWFESIWRSNMTRQVCEFTVLLVVACCARGQVLTVDNSGNVNAQGSVTGNRLTSSGAAGGQVSVNSGPDQAAPTTGFGIQAPSSITTGYQSVVPQAA